MKIRLSEITDSIFTGLSLSGRAPVGRGKHTIFILNVKNLVDGEIDTSELSTAQVEEPLKIQRYTIKPNDVLITTRGTLLKSAVVPQELAGYVISSNLAVIRLSPEAPITPVLLQAYLENPVGQQNVLALSRTTILQLALTARDIGEIEVPVLERQKQEKIEALSLATKQYLRFEKLALETRLKVSQQLLTEAFSGL